MKEVSIEILEKGWKNINSKTTYIIRVNGRLIEQKGMCNTS